MKVKNIFYIDKKKNIIRFSYVDENYEYHKDINLNYNCFENIKSIVSKKYLYLKYENLYVQLLPESFF